MVLWATVPVAHALGAEQRHDVPSPWIILSTAQVHERLPIVQAVPLSSKLDKGEGPYRAYRIRILEREITHYDVPKGLRAGDQLALTEQTRVLSHDRLNGDPIAMLSSGAVESVAAGVAYVMGL